MKRRTVLAALGTAPVALAGCTAVENGDDADGGGTAGGPDDGGGDDGRADAVSRPECEQESELIERQVGNETREYETAATVPYPEGPEAFTDDAILEYVEQFEHAYVTHSAICSRSDHILGVTYGVERSDTLALSEAVTAVFLVRHGLATSGIGDEGPPWVVDPGPPDGVVYAVDESGAHRVELDIEEVVPEDASPWNPDAIDASTVEAAAPDPVEAGELVAVFE